MRPWLLGKGVFQGQRPQHAGTVTAAALLVVWAAIGPYILSTTVGQPQARGAEICCPWKELLVSALNPRITSCAQNPHTFDKFKDYVPDHGDLKSVLQASIRGGDPQAKPGHPARPSRR